MHIALRIGRVGGGGASKNLPYREYIRGHLGLRCSKCLHVRCLGSATSGKMVQIYLYSFAAVFNTVRGQPVDDLATDIITFEKMRQFHRLGRVTSQC